MGKAEAWWRNLHRNALGWLAEAGLCGRGDVKGARDALGCAEA